MWRLTSATDPQQFVSYENGVNAACRIIIFATNDNLRLFANADTWFLDDNFKMVGWYMYDFSIKSHLQSTCLNTFLFHYINFS